ncbi:MAG: ABC transporter permease [Eubacterium sp.]|nr:ABC transporter permease [Eubacterium sp.]
MQVYKTFFLMLKKQKGMILMYLGIFVVVASLVAGRGQKNEEKQFQKETYTFAVLDEDKTEISRGLTKYLEKEHKRVEIQDDDEVIQDEIFARNVNAVIRIPKGFGEALKAGKESCPVLLSVPGTVYGQVFQSLGTEYEKVLKMNLAGGMDAAEALQATENACSQSVPVSFLESSENTQSHSSLYFFFVYIPYVFFSIGVMAFGTILIQFEKKELQRRMNCSGYSQGKIQSELLLGMLTAGGVLCLLYFFIAYAGVGNRIWSYKGLLSGINMICFMLVTFGFVYMISKMVVKTQLLSMISNLVGLGMCFLAGVFVPLEFLSDTIVKVAHFLPVYWYVEAIRRIDAMAEGSVSIANVLPDFGMQVLFAVTLAAVGAAYARRCQKRA